jgi:hypothetical protein
VLGRKDNRVLRVSIVLTVLTRILLHAAWVAAAAAEVDIAGAAGVT